MEKKERKPSYFARLKRRKQIKQCSETTVADPSDGSKHAGRENQDKPPASDKGTKLASDPAKTSANNKSNASDEDKKKKKSVKENKCTDLTKYNAIGAVRSHLCNLLYRPYYDNRDKTHEKKEKKMVVQKPNGTVEYIAKSQDTLSCIALKFNITPNKLVEINRLFSHTIVTGQKLYVPVMDHDSNRARSLSSDSPASPVSSSDAEYDKLLDADLARNSSKPIQRVLSSASEEEELVTVKFLKMSCRYITDGKGVVGGVMIVTPNSIMFDPHKSDPLVIENGCEEYGLICPMEEVLSIALYSDISHMKIKDALPSDLPKDLCPLYRPGEWEDLSCDQDINPFSRFQAKNKKKRRAHLSETVTPVLDSAEKSHSDEGFTELEPPSSPATGTSHSGKETNGIPVGIINGIDANKITVKLEPFAIEKDQSVTSLASVQESSVNPAAAGEVELRDDTSLVSGHSKNVTPEPPIHKPFTDIPKEDEQTSLKGNELPGQGKQAQGSPPMRKTSKVDFIDTEMLGSGNNNAYSDTFAKETTVAEGTGAHQNSLSDALNGKGPLLKSSEEGNQQKNSEAELKSWLLKKIEGPIEDMLPSKEEKSKTPPMFLSIKVGKPMRKTFADKSMAPIQHYARRGKQPEYWFAVPQERVDHLYAFFVQWSPEVYGKDAKEHGFVVVEKEELDMIDNFFSDTVPKSWEIINVNEARRQQSFSSFEDEVVEDLLPVLKDHSVLLEEPHIQKLAQCLPARTQGYPWRLVYSTAVHGTSLKTLYRNMTDLDSPVLLVIKDMDNQVFGALTSHPFKVSDHCYGTGETFFYSFNPDFKIFTWSGQNYYFIKGNIDSLQLGGGRGHFGLWLDSDLYHGSSYPCETFCNETLSKKEDFIVQDIEVWTFQ
ncbi:nuclear receptor coactivator 7-like isoform X2 [Polyodon spathula]|uniref:nuclear receptor coactivator 7-like isoform X2 n=1 Tax=Polyodon spathula TaxID=7913 RepID=UPI001B7F4CC9|nr:nuclear receptor coactivator 7-like isoform X2 [Polyodon spathula]